MRIPPNEEEKKLWDEYDAATDEEEKDKIMEEILAIHEEQMRPFREMGFA